MIWGHGLLQEKACAGSRFKRESKHGTGTHGRKNGVLRNCGYKCFDGMCNSKQNLHLCATKNILSIKEEELESDVVFHT